MGLDLGDQVMCSGESGECGHCKAKTCLTGCAATFREAMEENRRAKEERAIEREGEQPVPSCRPTKSFCVAKLAVAGQPDPLEGTYKQVETDNYERYLELVGAGKMTIGMIMKATRMVTLRLEEDRQWLIRCETTFKAKSMKGFNTAVPGKVVENKYQPGVGRRELLQDWDRREVETTLEVVEGSGAPTLHGRSCCCAGADCPSSPLIELPKLRLVQVVLPSSPHPGDLELEYSLDPVDQDTLIITVLGGGVVIATARLKRQKETRKISAP